MTEKKTDDDELTIDFSAIKKFFTSLSGKFTKAKKESGGSDEEELAVDFGRVASIVKSHPTAFLLLFVLLLQFIPNAGFLPWGGIWMRLQTQELPQVEEWARNSVYTYYRNQVAQAVNQQYPNLPDTNKAKLVDEQLNKLLAGQEGEVQKQIEGTTAYLKSFFQYESNGRTYTYMPDIDPYFYLRRTEKYLTTGYIGEKLPDGRIWDYSQLAPTGVVANPELHYYTLAYMHKMFSVFNPGITPMQSATYFPILFVTLAILFAFLIGNKLAGPVGGIFSSTMLAINAAAMGRTPWGHADTDAYNLFFPALVVWLLVESFEAQSVRKRIMYLVLTGVSIGIYAFAWVGYWYLFDFILAALLLQTAYLAWTEYSKTRSIPASWNSIKPLVLTIIAFIGLSAIFVTLLSTDSFFNTFLSPFKFTIIKAAAHASLWPNVYTTVAELNPINIEGIINMIGGRLLFAIAMAGIVLLMMRRKKDPHYVQYALLLLIWFASTAYASTKGIRFTLLIVPALSIAFGACAGLALQHIRVFAKRHVGLPAIVTTPLVIIIFAIIILYSGQVQASYAQAKGSMPIVDDAWWNALTEIKEKSQPNAIVNSWWDFGHHFKYIADRGVTFDGGTQNSPMAHWIGKVLLTENEDEAVGILRMLDCGSHYNAWDALFQQTNNDTVRSVNILHKIFPEHDKAKAKELLEKEGIQDPEAVLEYTHCENPPENYFITSEDMIGKSGVWAHFGSWNFERAYIWLVLKNQPKEQAVQYMIDNFNYTKSTAEQTYYDVKALPDEQAANQWIAPWPGYASGLTGCDLKGTSKIECGNGVQADLEKYDARIVTQGGVGIPKYFVYINETTKELQKAEYNNSNINVAVILVPRGTSYSVVLSTPELAASMFTRMYFMEGHGLRYFQPFTSQHHITGGDIFVYKTDWKPREPNIISALRPKTTVNNGDRVAVNYIGYLQNGSIFDASIPDWTKQKVKPTSDFSRYKTTPMTYVAGAGQTIKGFDNAVIGMNTSETKTFNVTPEEGYGTDPSKHPLANQTLFFKVRVEGIR